MTGINRNKYMIFMMLLVLTILIVGCGKKENTESKETKDSNGTVTCEDETSDLIIGGAPELDFPTPLEQEGEQLFLKVVIEKLETDGVGPASFECCYIGSEVLSADSNYSYADGLSTHYFMSGYILKNGEIHSFECWAHPDGETVAVDSNLICSDVENPDSYRDYYANLGVTARDKTASTYTIN